MIWTAEDASKAAFDGWALIRKDGRWLLEVTSEDFDSVQELIENLHAVKDMPGASPHRKALLLHGTKITAEVKEND